MRYDREWSGAEVGTKFFSSAIARSTVSKREDGIEQGADIKKFVPPRAISYINEIKRK